MNNVALYKKMYFIRKFEELLLDLFSKGKLNGTVHTCIGQEAIPVCLSPYIKDGDIIFSNHRSHGHLLALGVPPEKLLAEIMGKPSGLCAGRGGSQHTCYKGNITTYTNGIQGGIVGNAVGAALALKLNGNPNNNIVVVFLGDGTLGEGLIYESLNFAAIKKLPILFICENNGYAQSTKTQNVNTNISDRVYGFNIARDYVGSKSIEEHKEQFEYTIESLREDIRENNWPVFLTFDTYRLAPHSKGDDFRDKEEIEKAKTEDILNIFIRENTNTEVIAEFSKIEEEINKLYEEVEAQKDDCNVLIKDKKQHCYSQIPLFSEEKIRYVQSINKSLHNIMEEDKDVIILGEDIADPYGGAFKATKGLSTKYPNRTISTPISEAGIVSWCVGAAMQGKKAIAEIMFGDFLLLAADQIVNHACKYNWVYNDQVNINITIRTPMGGGRGYGATHSQTLEKMFIGVPDLTIVAPSHLLSPGVLLGRAVNLNSPVLFIENKSLYSKFLVNPAKDYDVYCTNNSAFPTLSIRFTKKSTTSYLFCYGGMVPIALELGKMLAKIDKPIELIIPSKIWPMNFGEIYDLIYDPPNHIITLEESNVGGGWGSELIASLMEWCTTNDMYVNVLRFGADPTPIPSNRKLEEKTLPSVERIYKALCTIL